MPLRTGRRPPPARGAAVARGCARHAAAGAAASPARPAWARSAWRSRWPRRSTARRPTSSEAFERDACGSCAACRRIARGVHPDVVLLAPGDSGSIKIEPVRDVIDQANFRPFEGRRRVVIIDEADALVEQAQHALLKTLEEPPSASVFLLVSSMPDALLPTVRSRCPRLRFGPLAPGEVAAALMRDHGYAEAEAHAAAADADGSVGRALSAGVGRSRRCTRDRHAGAAAGGPGRRSRAGGSSAAKELSPKKGGAGERARSAGRLPAAHGVAAARSRHDGLASRRRGCWPTPTCAPSSSALSRVV